MDYYNGTTVETYYYVLNLQGDVIEIRNDLNNVVCKYSYDAWGKMLSVKDGSGNTITAAGHIGNINPLRYRGYYYDTETGLYYLRSRYYDPVVCRFVNAEGYISTGQGILGYNMFTYTLNNPVNHMDYNGDIGIVPGLLCLTVFIFGSAVLLTGSEPVEPAPEQIVLAQEAAERAEIKVREDNNGEKKIDIIVNTKETINSFDFEFAQDYFYERLYERSVKVAQEKGVPIGNLMSVSHIRWEFQAHILALPFWDNADPAHLNVEETWWSLTQRGLEEIFK